MQMLSGASLRKALTWNALIVLSLLSPEVFGTPNITGVDIAGGLANGASVTIMGSGFGTKSPAAPYLWADFGEGNINPSPLGQDTAWSLTQNMVYSPTGGPNNGPYAQGSPQSGSGVYWTLMLSPPYDTITGSWHFTWNDLGAKYFVFRKMRKNFAVANTINWKDFRMSMAASGGIDWYFAPNNGNIDVEGLTNAYAATIVNGQGTQTSPSVLEGPLNQWFSDEIIYQVNSTLTSQDGLMWWYVNGQLVGQEPVNMGWTQWPLQLRGSTTQDITTMSIQGVADNDPAFPTSNTFGLADVYVDNTWSRVMIGNASTWAASTVHDVEIPTAWSDGSINAVLHNDSLPNLDGAYLYVFDSNGNVNPNGYPLCGSCPQPPSNLIAN